MNLYPLIACAALTCLIDPLAQAQSTSSAAAIAASAPAARPAIRLQQSSQKSKPSPHADSSASNSAVTSLQHTRHNDLSNREKLAKFHPRQADSGAASDDVRNNDTAYASPYTSPPSTTPAQTQP
jgi:hypothetical protein